MQILLAFTLLRDDVIPIPKASSVAHTSANREAAEIILTQEERDLLDREFPKPDRKVPLDME